MSRVVETREREAQMDDRRSLSYLITARAKRNISAHSGHLASSSPSRITTNTFRAFRDDAHQ